MKDLRAAFDSKEVIQESRHFLNSLRSVFDAKEVIHHLPGSQ